MHPSTLVVEKYGGKIARGLFNAGLYGTVGYPISMYHYAGRIEVWLTGKDPYDHVVMYTEFTGTTTLPPLPPGMCKSRHAALK
jgi:hypothetical protein